MILTSATLCHRSSPSPVSERARKTQADVAAAGDHHALDRLVHAAQLVHHRADVLRVAARKNTSSPGWIIVSPSTGTLASSRNIATMRVSTFGIWRRSSLIGCDTSGPPANARTAIRLARPSANSSTCSASGNSISLQQIVGHRLLGEDHLRSAEAALADQVRMLLQLGVAHARDTRRNVVQIGGDLAGDQVGLVERGDGDQHVGVVGRAACLQHRRQRRIADQAAQIEPVLQLGDTRAVGVDHRDVVGFGHQASATEEPTRPAPTMMIFMKAAASNRGAALVVVLVAALGVHRRFARVAGTSVSLGTSSGARSLRRAPRDSSIPSCFSLRYK